MKKIGVLVVTYNQYEVTKLFLTRFINTFVDTNIILLILDNCSNDATYKKIRAEYPFIDIRRLNDNYGCVTGRNIGIVELIKIGCEYIAIFDNDIEIRDKDFFKKLYHFMEENSIIDGCCPIVKWANDNTVQTMGRIINKMGIIRNITKVTDNLFVDILPGCAQFIRASAFLKYGLFDNDLSPISIEDVEFGMRLKKFGAKLCYNPHVEVFHLHERRAHDSRLKRRYVIQGRVVLLKKAFNIFRCFQEIIYMFFTIKNYGILFTLSSYCMAFRKKITKNNFNFVEFNKSVVNFYDCSINSFY